MNTLPTTHLPAYASRSGDSDGPDQAEAERKRLSFADLNPILGPVLVKHRESPVLNASLAVACRGLDESVKLPPGLIRRWLRSRGGERFATITATPRSFQRVITKARAEVASASSLPARRQKCVRVARGMVARVLSPAPAEILTRVRVCATHGQAPNADAECRVIRKKGSPMPPAENSACEAVKVEMLVSLSAHRSIRARHALAIVGLALLDSIHEKNWNTVQVSADALAVTMGCKERAARDALKDCVSLGWLRVVSKAHRQATRYKIPPRLTNALDDVALDHAETVDALAEGTPEIDPVAEVLAVASHPAVGYDRDEREEVGGKRRLVRKGIDAKAWLVAAAVEASVDPTTLEVSRRTAREVDKAWKRALTDSGYHGDTTLRDALDNHAARVGAAQRAAQAEVERRERAARHRAGAEASRAEKAAKYAAAPAEESAKGAEPSAPSSGIERITIKLPHGFDAAKHQRALMKLIADNYGSGFDLDSIDPDQGTATASRQVAITEVQPGGEAA